jgi:hypothetical protein
MEIDTSMVYLLEVCDLLERWNYRVCAVVGRGFVERYGDELEFDECLYSGNDAVLLGENKVEVKESYLYLREFINHDLEEKFEKVVEYFIFHLELEGGDIVVGLTLDGRYWVEMDLNPSKSEEEKEEVRIIYKTIKTMMPQWIPEIKYIHPESLK